MAPIGAQRGGPATSVSGRPGPRAPDPLHLRARALALADLEPAREAREREVDDEEEESDHQIDLEQRRRDAAEERGGVDRARMIEHLGDPEDRDQRRVLVQRDQLRDGRRDHPPQALRQDHEPHLLPVREPERRRGLALAAIKGEDAGAHDLAEDGRVVEHERQDRPEDELVLERLREPARNVRPPKFAPRARDREQAEVEDDQDQRQVSPQVDPDAGRDAEQPAARDPHQGEQQAEDQREDDPDRGDLEVDQEALEQELEVVSASTPIPSCRG